MDRSGFIASVWKSVFRPIIFHFYKPASNPRPETDAAHKSPSPRLVLYCAEAVVSGLNLRAAFLFIELHAFIHIPYYTLVDMAFIFFFFFFF
jgi:hypothetical protein